MAKLPENERDQFEVEKAIAPPVSEHNSDRWERLYEIILTGLLGGIPRPIGTGIRRLFYPSMFAHVGRGAYIQEGCEFIGAKRIDVGKATKILRDVRLNITSGSLLRLGREVCLDRGVDIGTMGKDCLIEIGDGSFLGPYACVEGPGNIKIGRHCLIASHSGIYASNRQKLGLSRDGIEIGDNCWLGTGVKILDGVTIGRDCVIGAGSVVTKSIPPFSVAVGVPAKVIKESKEEAS